MSIHNFPNKIKGWAGERRHTLVFIAILVAVAAASFYVGYTARAESHTESLVAINCPANAYMDSLALSGDEDLTTFDHAVEDFGHRERVYQACGNCGSPLRSNLQWLSLVPVWSHRCSFWPLAMLENRTRA